MFNPRPQLVSDEIYHISSRAVGDTVIFDSEDDFYRGIFCIYEFNTGTPVEILKKRLARNRFKTRQKATKLGGRRTSAQLQPDGRDRLVDILAFSFMPNHLHLILRQIKDNGISNFMKKVNGGYAKYFNEKYKRKGHLFSKFYPVHIKDNNQLKSGFVYVHTNLISLVEPGWKEKGIENPEKVIEFLENNKRHSYPDYLGKKAFPSVTERDFLLEAMGGEEGCRAEVGVWVKYKKELRDLSAKFSK